MEAATPEGLLNHAERFMANAGYAVQARSPGSITFSGRIGMGRGMQALTLGISLFDPHFAVQGLTAHNTGATESTTLVVRQAPGEAGSASVTIPDDGKPVNNLLRFWLEADVLRQPLPEPMLRFRDTKPFRGYIGLFIFNVRVEWHEGTWRLKLSGEPMRMEEIREVRAEGKRANHKLVVEGKDGRVFEMGHLTAEQAQNAKDLVEQRIVVHAETPDLASLTGASAAGSPADSSSPSGLPGQIRQLAALRDEGILTEEQFEQKKQDLLDRM